MRQRVIRSIVVLLAVFGSAPFLLRPPKVSPAAIQSSVTRTPEDFKPWLVERSRLFAAVDTLDGGKKRGLLLIE
jgi:hypothetical protein